MANLRAELQYATPPAWADRAVEDFETFLQEHANMERKASAQAMSFVVKYPDRTEILPQLIEIAQEELDHFRQVYERMAERGIGLARDTQSPYANELHALCRNGRDDRFMDRMLVVSMIETRAAERFRLISEALEDPDWKRFYRDLWASEALHGNVFVEMLFPYFDREPIYERLEQLMAAEAEIIRRLPWRASLI